MGTPGFKPIPPRIKRWPEMSLCTLSEPVSPTGMRVMMPASKGMRIQQEAGLGPEELNKWPRLPASPPLPLPLATVLTSTEHMLCVKYLLLSFA